MLHSPPFATPGHWESGTLSPADIYAAEGHFDLGGYQAEEKMCQYSMVSEELVSHINHFAKIPKLIFTQAELVCNHVTEVLDIS